MLCARCEAQGGSWVRAAPAALGTLLGLGELGRMALDELTGGMALDELTGGMALNELTGGNGSE